MDQELIDAKWEIKRLIEPEGYLVAITESSHEFAGKSIHFEVEYLVTSELAKIAGICAEYDVVARVSGKGKNALLTLSII